MNADWYPGIKAFCLHWSHAAMLQQTFATLEREFNEDSDACVDASKAIVECACRVIIEGLDDPVNPLKPTGSDAALSDLLAAATRLLGLGEIRHRPFADLIREHNRLSDTLRKLRNEAGTVSHGKDGFIAKLSVHHRRAALLAADAIVTFLHEAYLERELDPVRTMEPYERFKAANATIDRFASIVARENEEGLLAFVIRLPGGEEVPLALEPSRLLFGVDREAYKSALAICRDAETMEGPPTEEAA